MLHLPYLHFKIAFSRTRRLLEREALYFSTAEQLLLSPSCRHRGRIQYISSCPPHLLTVTMTSASIDIPEILLLISTHLELEHIVRCTLVNKAWYAAFAPLLFRKINWSNAKSIALERYCVHATLLSISMRSPIFEVIASKCTRLTELVLRYPCSSSTSLSKKWIDILQNNPRIVKVTALELTPRSLSDLAEHCPNLQEFVISGFEFSYWRDGPKSGAALVSPLWRIAQGLTSLDLGFNMYTVDTNVLSPCPDPEGLPMMRHLLLGASYSNLLVQFRFICCCKNLETLSWDMQQVRAGAMGASPFRELFTSLLHLRELRLFLPSIRASLEEGQLTFMEGEQLYEFLILLPPCVIEFEVRAYATFNIADTLIQGPLSRQFMFWNSHGLFRATLL